MSGDLATLDRELRAISDAYTGTCTWSLTVLGSGEHIAHDEDAVMPTASLIKVPVLAALYQAVANGRVSLADRVMYGREHRCLGSGVLAKLDFGVQLTVRDAAVLMMIISDNSATNMCIDLAGLPFVNEMAGRMGLSATRLFRRLGDNSAGLDARKMSVSSSGDIVKLLTLIARHECVSAEASEDMLRIMRRSDYRHELSRELPWNEMNMLGDPKECVGRGKGRLVPQRRAHGRRGVQGATWLVRPVGFLRRRHRAGHRARGGRERHTRPAGEGGMGRAGRGALGDPDERSFDFVHRGGDLRRLFSSRGGDRVEEDQVVLHRFLGATQLLRRDFERAEQGVDQ